MIGIATTITTMTIAFQLKGEDMQRDHRRAFRWHGFATMVLCACCCGSAVAQSAAGAVPDHAALIGVPMTAGEVVRSRTAEDSEHEVQRKIDAAGVHRTAAQRVASEGLNRTLAKMPATAEQALRQAAANKYGPMIVLTSRQQIQPLYAAPDMGAGTTASHGADDFSVR